MGGVVAVMSLKLRMCRSCDLTMPFDYELGEAGGLGGGADNSEFWTRDGKTWRTDCRWCYRVLRDRFACGGAGYGGRKHRRECKTCSNPFRANRQVILQVIQAWGAGGYRTWVTSARCIRFPVTWLRFPGVPSGTVVDPAKAVVALDGPAFPQDHDEAIVSEALVPVGPMEAVSVDVTTISAEALQGNALTVTQPTDEEKWKLAYAPIPGAPEWYGDPLTGKQKAKLLISMDVNPSLRDAMIEAGWGTEWEVAWLHKGQAREFMTGLHGTKAREAKTEWSAEDVVTALMYERVEMTKKVSA